MFFQQWLEMNFQQAFKENAHSKEGLTRWSDAFDLTPTAPEMAAHMGLLDGQTETVLIREEWTFMGQTVRVTWRATLKPNITVTADDLYIFQWRWIFTNSYDSSARSGDALTWIVSESATGIRIDAQVTHPRFKDFHAQMRDYAEFANRSALPVNEQASEGQTPEGDELLTKRQREVAHLLADGMGYEEISKQLTIAESTVKKHGDNIQERWGISGGEKILQGETKHRGYGRV